jgi:hypothetical protein
MVNRAMLSTRQGTETAVIWVLLAVMNDKKKFIVKMG